MTTWQYLKQVINSKLIYPQYVEDETYYKIKLIDNTVLIDECLINKSLELEDKVDFETNYKPYCNKPIKTLSKPFADADGFRARFGGHICGEAAFGETTNFDYYIDEERWINAVELILKDQAWGDYVKLQVVDKDNILGYGANVVLDTFGDNWNLTTDQERQGPYPAQFPARLYAGLYARLVYVSTGGTNVKVKVNYYLYKKT